MADLTRLSVNKLNALIARRFEASRIANKAVIAAGLGSMRGFEMRQLVRDEKLAPDQLAAARASIAADTDYHAAVDELAARRRWHGEDKPIRRTG